MSTRRLLRFALEDFFDQYEHRPDLINLASSDGLPWTVADLQAAGVAPIQRETSLQYPDSRAELVPALQSHCCPPDGAGVLPTSGAAEAMAIVMHELATAQDQSDHRPIGMPQPAFGAFRGLASMLGIATETYDYASSRGWTPDVDEIVQLAARCRALVVINPHNPTGCSIADDAMAAIAKAVAKSDAVLIVNEVFRTPGETAPAIRLGSHVITLGSFSKMYGLPGLRLGWIMCDAERLKRYRTVQQYLSLSLSAMTVTLGAVMLRTPDRFIRTALIHENRRVLKEWVETQKGAVSISPCTGGTTTCLSIDTTRDESTLFKELVEAGVLLIPGEECFDYRHSQPWFRLGYAGDPGRLVQGLSAIARVIR